MGSDMQASEDCLEFIRKKEAFFAHAYVCPAGVVTIGYGTTRWDLKTPIKMGETITHEEAERQLAIEVQRCTDAVAEAVKVPLSQNELDALVSWAYNVGTGWITGRGHTQATLIKLLNQGKYEAVPGQLLLFCRTTGGKRLDGLYTRRKEEAQMWLAHDHAAVVAAAIETKLDEVASPDGSLGGAMPQAVAPVPAMTAAKAVVSSPTVGAASIGLLAGIGQAASSLWSWLTDAGQQITAAQGASGPFGELFKALHINMANVTLTIIIGALVFVGVRHVMQKREGIIP
jgi:GH24 family phage-related lysozyme (muramidase)